jgi:bacillithiol biosynthesis cysteine-adding enzyme BshC
MILSIEPRELLGAADNKLYLDYISGGDAVDRFYTHPPTAFVEALAARRACAFPRQAVSRLLAEYNDRLGAHPRALAHAKAFVDPDTFCVITGQQAGFMGGPAYTAFKICTAIRLAKCLAGRLGVRVVPIFWLASEDHDFQEINHTYLIKSDGEIGRVRFKWPKEGRPISDLPITGDVRRAYDEYWERIVPTAHTPYVREIFSFRPEERLSDWQARMWSSLFSSRGLVLVEPHVIRSAAPEFFRFALENVEEISGRLRAIGRELTSAGYDAALTSEQAGLLYTFDAAGQRVRVQDPQAGAADAARYPERYSTDAALRPLLADAVLPVLGSVLGPGETAYQAMLKPLYELFGVQQPLLYPRQSYTVVARREVERLDAYQIDPPTMLAGPLDLDAILGDLVPQKERNLFAEARQGIEQALAPLRPYACGIDPDLDRTWTQTVHYATRGLAKLEQRVTKARTRQLGFSKGELRHLQNAWLPRGRLQERVLPLSHFMNRFGPGFIDAILEVGELGDFRHHLFVMEEDRG